MRPSRPSRPLRPRIALSQNFLRDPRLVDDLLDRSTIGDSDLVYEIGPGDGIVTERLARRCLAVTAIEKDPLFAARLSRRIGDRRRPNVSLYLADFLTFPLPITPYKVFANPPFNVTAAVVGRLIDAPTPPTDAYLVAQREAAARFVGLPEAAGETLTAALLKPWFEPEIVHRFRREDFVPAPRVDVVMLRLRKRGPPLVGPDQAQRYRDLVTACFVAWRPTVGHALAGVLGSASARTLRASLPASPSLASTWTSKPSAVPFDAWLEFFHALTSVAGAPTWQQLSGAERRLRQQQARLQKVHRTRVRPPPTVCSATADAVWPIASHAPATHDDKPPAFVDRPGDRLGTRGCRRDREWGAPYLVT